MTGRDEAAPTLAQVGVGDSLGRVSLSLSVQKLVMIAAANRDFAPTHHDPKAARETGAETAYANMMFLFAMAERLLLQWAGPTSRLRSVEGLRMLAFNRAGDDVTCTGRVTGVDSATRRVTVDIWVESSSDRRTAVGTAVVELAA